MGQLHTEAREAAECYCQFYPEMEELTQIKYHIALRVNSKAKM